MEAIIYTIFAIFAVYGMYSAARESVLLVTRLRGKTVRDNTLCSGCKYCDKCHTGEDAAAQPDDTDEDDEDKDFFCT